MCAIARQKRPGLVVVANSLTPYRINLHREIAAGIPELQLHTLITHGVGDFDWRVDAPTEIDVTNVSAPGEHPLDSPLRRPLVEWRKASRLISYLKKHDARAVIFSGYRYISYLRVMAFCHAVHIPFYVNNDSNILNEPDLSFAGRISKSAIYSWWLKRSAGVMSMGELGDRFFLKYGADPERIYRVPYWPDYDAFAAVDDDALSRFKRRFGLCEGHHYFVFSGRLIREKRVDLLVDAFAKIASDRPNWDLLIVGDGVLNDELHQRVPEALRHRVVWTGFLDRGEPALAYHCADVLVLPSESEPWAVVVQEALAAGLTVVASDVVGAAHELVNLYGGGRVFKSGDSDSLRRALEDVTQPGQIEAKKAQAAAALEKWRQDVNPITEIRRALVDSGALVESARISENQLMSSDPSHG